MRRGWRWLMVAGLLAGLAPLLPVAVTVADNAVVAAPCAESDFDTALATAQTNGGGTITFNCGGPMTIIFSGQKTITSPNNVIIDGASIITLDGDDNDRLFYVESGATLDIRNLTIQNGEIDEDGGAIYAEASSTLKISNSLLRWNIAEDGEDGGAIWSNGTLTIDGSTFYQNEGNDGGAIDNDGEGSTTITNSTFDDNEAYDGDGGAIDNSAPLTISNSTFENNDAYDDGGAIWTSDAVVAITESTFEGNDADDDGGAIDYDGADDETDSLTITRSTFYDNDAYDDGGALYLDGSLVTIDTSTISDNEAYDEGGGIYTEADVVNILHSTITLNYADYDGSGIYEDDGTITFLNTIIADNDYDDCDGSFVSNGYNLDSDDTCDLDQPTDWPDSDPDLGPLQDNGGPTMTHMPSMTGDAFENGGGCSGTDQRLRPRPVGDGCEIGSVELQTDSTYPLCVHFYDNRVLSPLSGECGAGQYELDVPEIYPTTFCVDAFTGIVYYFFGNPSCNPPRQAHMMPGSGDLLTCVHAFTQTNRRVFDHSQCGAHEIPNLIPATL